MKEQLENVSHDYIRYANCWEDAELLAEGLKIAKGNKVLSIGSAGDNSFFLLTKDVSQIVAVDINKVQLNLIELKKACFKGLDYEEMIRFLGFVESEDRLDYYEKIKYYLTDEVRMFWEGRKDELQKGIIYQGKFENYFGYFRKFILPLIHSKRRVDELFRVKSEDAQKEYFDQVWNNRRWRLLFKIFFSRFVMGRLGRDPAFLKEVEVPVGEFIFKKAADHLSSVYCQNNYFLHFIMTGNFGNKLPPYARKENFDSIKKNIDKLEVFEGFAEDAFEKYGNFDRFNLSNIFEYMDESLFKVVGDSMMRHSNQDARFAYWNLMVSRRMSETIEHIEFEEVFSNYLTERDKGFFYMRMVIEAKN